MISADPIGETLEVYLSRVVPSPPLNPEAVDPRIVKVNAYLALGAAKVFNDEAALQLLAELHQQTVIRADALGPCPSPEVLLALAKLAAAAFCDVGTDVISITNEGEEFVSRMLAGSLERG